AFEKLGAIDLVACVPTEAEMEFAFCDRAVERSDEVKVDADFERLAPSFVDAEGFWEAFGQQVNDRAGRVAIFHFHFRLPPSGGPPWGAPGALKEGRKKC